MATVQRLMVLPWTRRPPNISLTARPPTARLSFLLSILTAHQHAHARVSRDRQIGLGLVVSRCSRRIPTRCCFRPTHDRHGPQLRSACQGPRYVFSANAGPVCFRPPRHTETRPSCTKATDDLDRKVWDNSASGSAPCVGGPMPHEIPIRDEATGFRAWEEMRRSESFMTPGWPAGAGVFALLETASSLLRARASARAMQPARAELAICGFSSAGGVRNCEEHPSMSGPFMKADMSAYLRSGELDLSHWLSSDCILPRVPFLPLR